MSKLITMLVAAGFGLGFHSATAQDVTSEGAKAQRQEQMMKEKEQGTGQSQSGARERPAPSYERTQGGQQGDNSSARGQGDNSSAQGDQSATQGKQVPEQSMPSVGHPKEGAQQGQFGNKKMDESGQSQGGAQSPSR